MSDVKDKIRELLNKDRFCFDDLCALVSVLRSEEGCPWDREQTNKSIRNCFIDETYEFIEGLDCDDNELMCEELGDVLFQIVFHADIKNDSNAFGMDEIIDGICKKMILRHPHVFADTTVENSSEVLVNWDIIKNDEKQRKTPYEQLKSVSAALPALMRAQKLRSKAIKNNLIEECDFDAKCDTVQGLLNELRDSKNPDKLGELLSELTALSRIMDVEAEEVLYKYNNAFVEKYK